MSGSGIREGQPDGAIREVRAVAPGRSADALQEGHSHGGDIARADAVSSAGLSPYSRERPTREQQGPLRAILCLLLYLGLWRMPLPGSGQNLIACLYSCLSRRHLTIDVLFVLRDQECVFFMLSVFELKV